MASSSRLSSKRAFASIRAARESATVPATALETAQEVGSCPGHRRGESVVAAGEANARAAATGFVEMFMCTRLTRVLAHF